MGLTDLHSHILPGIDDGAVDLDDSVAMARQAAADGITVVCATPHIRHDHDIRVGELSERIAQLNEALAEQGVPVAIAQGGEVSATALDRLDETELRLVSLGGAARWILLEPAPGPLDDSMSAVVDRLAERGYLAVIAHPERHVGPEFEQHLMKLVERRALVQVTAAHVLSDDAGPVLVDLATRGRVHLVASDAHTTRWGRPVAIRAAIDRLAREAGESIAAFARDAPTVILRGEDAAPSQPAVAPTSS